MSTVRERAERLDYLSRRASEARTEPGWRDLLQCAAADLLELEAENARLADWKASAMNVLSRWDDVWVAMGKPGALGEDKATAALRSLLSPEAARD